MSDKVTLEHLEQLVAHLAGALHLRPNSPLGNFRYARDVRRNYINVNKKIETIYIRGWKQHGKSVETTRKP